MAPNNEYKIRLALHNVESGIGTTRGYWQYLIHYFYRYFPHSSERIDAIGMLLAKQKVDIFAAAEIDGGSARVRFVNQVEALQKHSPLDHFVFFPTYQSGSRINQGNSIHSRFEILSSKNHRLPGAGEPRFAGEACLMINGARVTVIVTHLSLRYPYREAQIEALSGLVNRIDTPIILAGDFNVYHEGELELIEKSQLQKVYTAKTYPVWKPRRRLDYIFASHDIRIGGGEVISDPLSDHCMLLAELYLTV
jgi:endonuclease/exonuclease/phosphatase family metal-dependent hydrolase